MKKIAILSVIFCFMSSVSVIAGDFDKLEDLSPEQKQQLTQIHANYKEQINSIDDDLMNYSNKILQVKQDKDKTAEQSMLLISAYERNIESLKNQKKQLEAKKDSEYKAVMTVEQYKQYSAQQIVVDNAFSEFLKK